MLVKPKNDISHASLTPLGETLAEQAQRGDFQSLYKELATHILLKLHGLDLVQCVDDLAARGTKITKATISKELGYRGFHIPNNGTHLNGMRAWLEQAGLVEPPDKWQADPAVLRELLGEIGNEELDEYAELNREQRAFALAFARMDQDEALSNRVATYAKALYGVEYPEGGLPQSTLFALEKVGLLTCHN